MCCLSDSAGDMVGNGGEARLEVGSRGSGIRSAPLAVGRLVWPCAAAWRPLLLLIGLSPTLETTLGWQRKIGQTLIRLESVRARVVCQIARVAWLVTPARRASKLAAVAAVSDLRRSQWSC